MVLSDGAMPLKASSYNNLKKEYNQMKIPRYGLLPIAVVCFLTLTIQLAKATPYASCITNNNGTIQFYLNESGGNVTVTYEDGSTNANFDGIATGTNLAAGQYSFLLGTHTSYSISVYKVGTGVPSVISSPLQNANSGNGFFIIGDLRGIDVNKDPASPYFGRIYIDASARTAPAKAFYCFNSDGSFVSSNNAGITFVSGNASSPYRCGVAPDDYLMVGDFSSAGSAIYRVDPTLQSNQLVLGPVGVSAGQTAGTHGSEESHPIIINGGNLQNGQSVTMLEIDGDFPTSGTNYNSILVYSNLTLATLPDLTNPPSLIGPDIGLAAYSGEYLGNVYPGLTAGTNGYIYASNQRNNWGIPVVDIVDQTLTNVIWQSLPSANVNVGPDYFVTQVENNGYYGPIDSAVSPDSAYFITMAIDNHYTICQLTNGIPDVRTIYTVNPTSLAQNGRGICWDAADNFYSISSGTAWAQAWTLGLTTTTITTGNASGQTGFQVIYPPNQVTVTASNSFISQANSYNNPTSTSFVIVRSGSPTNSITVDYSLSGTAFGVTNGGTQYPAEFTVNPPGSVTFGVGQTSAVVTVTAVSDDIPRPTTTLTINLLPAGSYQAVFPKSASINILNVAPQELLTSIGAPTMYNAFSNDYVSLSVTRWGDTNVSAYSVNTFGLSGTAVEGTDYTPPTPITFNPGDLTKSTYIYPLVDGQMPVHTNNLPFVGNKTIVASVVSSGNYTAVGNTNTLTILDSANPSATVLFYDPLTNSDDSTNWGVAATDENYPATPPDYFADFGYNLLVDSRDPGGPGLAIPFPPSGALTALRVTANKSNQGVTTTPGAAVNLYPTNVAFSGNYAVRFSMNITEPNAFATGGSFEGPLFGINHNGTETNWWAWSSVTGTQTSWHMDGIWFWVSDSGFVGAGYGQYSAFAGNGNPATNSGSVLLAGLSDSPFVQAFKTNVFTFSSTPEPGLPVGQAGLPANGAPDSSANDSSWADVEIKQFNNVVTLSIDKTMIYAYTNTTGFTNGTIMLGYEAPVDGDDGGDGAVYYSNLRVVRLLRPAVTGTAFNAASGTFTFDFTVTDDTAALTVVGATNVTGPYTAVSGATITSLGGGAYEATVPVSGTIHFYRIQQKF